MLSRDTVSSLSMNPNRHHFDFQRFVDAQNDIYARVITELRAGRKQTHWMWFIFPQIKGLGRSPTAQQYEISSLLEATAYSAHPLLGSRLRECTNIVNELERLTIVEVFGYPDHLKFRSSMTLFAKAAPNQQPFLNALAKYFHSELDTATLERI